MQQYPLVQLPGLKTIEAEKDEVIVGPDKVAYDIGGKYHKNGGTDLIAEEGSYILSRHLKLPKTVVKSLGHKEKETSPADLSRKTPTDVYKKVIDSKDIKRYDDLSRKTASLMFAKNAAHLDVIFAAQEEFKASKGMKNDADKAALGRQQLYQKGGMIQDSGAGYDNINPVYDPYESIPDPFKFGNVKNVAILDAKNTPGYSRIEDGKKAMYFRPFANDPYFDVQKELLKNGVMSAKDKKILGDRQKRLSDLKGQFPGETGSIIEKEYAKYLRDADKVEKDQYLDKFVKLSDGSEIPLETATDEQIDQANGFRFLNKRTGNADLVDYRDRQNQGFDPTLRFEQRDPIGLTNFDPLPQRGLSASPASLPVIQRVPEPPLNPAAGAGAVKKGRDMQSIVNGVQIGLLAADMANTRTKPPYYDFRPSEIAYTRFEALNTKQQERAFSIGRQAIESSNLPASVKAAQLANMSANLAEGVNQIDLNNYQNKLSNDNRNVDLFERTRNFDIQNEQQKNLAYVAEADRRNAQANMQKQEYLTNIMQIAKDHFSNRRDIGLVNQLSRNYDYSLNSQQVEYQKGQGVNPSTNQLAAYQLNKIDPRYLNEEGRKALGYE